MKNYKEYIKSERGSIVSVILATLLFFMAIVSTAYMVTATLRKTQIKSQMSTIETYEQDFANIYEIYDSLLED